MNGPLTQRHVPVLRQLNTEILEKKVILCTTAPNPATTMITPTIITRYEVDQELPICIKFSKPRRYSLNILVVKVEIM